MYSSIVPTIPDSLELIKLRDCFPYRRFYPAFNHFTDEDTGVLDYSSQKAREVFEMIDDEMHDLGFRRREVIICAAAALIDLAAVRKFVDYVEESGDLFAYA